MKKKSVSLVLGSGGARGLSHVGVIRWLEEHDYKIESISGCSIGALIGGFYAAGKLDDYVKWIEEIDTISMFKLLDFKGSGGLVSGDKLMMALEKILDKHDIEELPISFTAVATDIKSQKEVWINKGSLISAIRASISLPLFFEPYIYNDKYLVDGGVLNPVPIAPIFHDETDISIAINLGGEADFTISLESQKEKQTLAEKFKEYITTVSLPDSLTKEDGLYSVANNSFEAMQSTIARVKLAAYPPDVEIVIPRNICGTFEFNRSKELIEYGYNLCKKNHALQGR